MRHRLTRELILAALLTAVGAAYLVAPGQAIPPLPRPVPPLAEVWADPQP